MQKERALAILEHHVDSNLKVLLGYADALEAIVLSPKRCACRSNWVCYAQRYHDIAEYEQQSLFFWLPSQACNSRMLGITTLRPVKSFLRANITA